MNKTRSKQLQKVIEKLALLRDQASRLQEQEQNFFDNASDKVQEGERGQEAEEAISNMEAAVSSIEEAMESLTFAQGEL